MEQSIDQQRLPGVREVCRDFAVLEDHSLAHNLQEQEIEHHLASNIQRTRLVQHDLVMAKQLQEEEDLRAQQRLKKRHKDLERQDCEIAQEIQEKLVIEADRRRRQEEKDEDIARLLQEELLKEEKKRKKQFSEPLVADDGSFHPAAASSRGRHNERHADYVQSHRTKSGEPPERSKDDCKCPQPAVSPDTHRHGRVVSDRSRRHSDDTAERDGLRHRDQDRSSTRKERPQRPPAPRSHRDADRHHSPKGQEHSEEHLSGRCQASRSQERSPPRRSIDTKVHKSKEREHNRADHWEPKQMSHAPRSPSPYNDTNAGRHRDAGMRTRGSRDVAHVKPRVVVDDLQLDDAAIARRLQEEELRASQEDERAAQVAQDEEIARLFMEREKKAHRKPKSSEKMPHEKRRPEECNVEVNELGHSRSRDRQDQPRSRSDKPSRPPPPGAEIIADLENNRSFEKPSSSTRPFSKSESSPKGSYHRQ
ncbi:coiled-coil domain-containing protein 50 isoform X1 [Ambystoma mexicanum]|uniref:coiled-coil domain-containing protein 50 isoform X1 n=1 Tax=Ambystoma mexicanum TaxID=8296 RepID=UPI0037E8EC9E